VFVNFESSFLQGDNTSVAENGFFMAPETRRSGVMTCKSDVFSLGMVFGALHLCAAPDQWPSNHVLPNWTKIMLLVDTRARGMPSTALHVMGQEETATPCRNPFFAALQSAMSVYDAQRIRGWTDLSSMDVNQPWDVAMQPMLLFVATFYDQLEPAVLNLVITTLHRATTNPLALTLVHKINGDDAYLTACARVQGQPSDCANGGHCSDSHGSVSLFTGDDACTLRPRAFPSPSSPCKIWRTPL
jgi:hypothetical protein